jgi:acyl carrier protein
MSDKVYEQVLAVVRRVVRRQSVDPMMDFFDLDANSLDILQIVELVNDECGVSVTVTDAFDASDIDAFAQLVAQHFEA